MNDPNNGCTSITLFAKQPDQLPQFKRIGDIIRIHKANVGQYKNHKTLCVNVNYGSNWTIFEGFVPPVQGDS